MLPRPPSSTLFPYTTLFRSSLNSGGSMENLERSSGSLRPVDRYDVGHVQEVVRQAHDELRQLIMSLDRKSTRLNSSHMSISYAVFCLKKKKKINMNNITITY